MSSKLPKLDGDAESPGPLTPISPGKTMAQSLAFGLLFVPVTIVVLFGKAVVDWLRFDDWYTSWIWDRRGYPAVGLFAITSASFFLHRVIRCRFVFGLTFCAVGTMMCYAIGNAADAMPPHSKLDQLRWHDPDVLAWLLIPPWGAAIAWLMCHRAMGAAKYLRID